MDPRWRQRPGAAGLKPYPGSVQAMRPRSAPLAAYGTEPRFLERLALFLLAALVFTIPWEDWLIIPGLGTVSRLVGIVAISAAVLGIVEKRTLRLPHPACAFMVAFVLWSMFSLLWTKAPNLTGIAAASNAELLIMAWLIWELCDCERQVLLFLQAFVLGCYVSSLDTIFEYLQGRQAAFERYAGAGFNPNDLAILMVLSIPIAYYLSLKIPGARAWVNRVEIVLATVTIFLTGSRAASLALIVALAIIPLTYSSLTRREKFGSVAAAIAALAASLLFIPASSWARLATASSEIQQGTLNDRTVIWRAALTLFENHPVLGVGAGTFAPSVQTILGQALSAHNTFLSVLIEGGLVGFGFFLSIALILMGSSLRLPCLERSLWLVVFSAWAVGLISAAWESRKPTWFLFGICAAQIALHWSMQHRTQRIGHLQTA